MLLSTWVQLVVPLYLLLQGGILAGLWTMSIAGGLLREGIFRSNVHGMLLWPYVTAELLTAGGLVAGGIGLLTAQSWGRSAALISLGALVYAGIRNLDWTLTDSHHRSYAIPMLVGIVGAIGSIGLIVAVQA